MSDHPLSGFELSLHSVKCFDESGSGFFHFAPITLVIGRNNSGKSTIVDFLMEASRKNEASLFPSSMHRRGWQPWAKYRKVVDEEELQTVFSSAHNGGEVPGNHWTYGAQFIGTKVDWRISTRDFPRFYHSAAVEEVVDGAKDRLSRLFPYPFSRYDVVRVAAERNIVPEGRNGISIEPYGTGISSAINAFLTRSDLDAKKVEADMLNDLNLIYKGDAHFSRINSREQVSLGAWEIYLTEDEKGDIPLSQSGSSLKTVISVLAFIHLHQAFAPNKGSGNAVLCIEEPENNLHPGLLRRLLEYVATRREEHGFSLVMTTHSPVGIDWATRRNDTTIIHVQHKEGRSVCSNVLDHFGRTDILNDLDIRGSDILQANGIIWVEGLSDRIYLKRWISLFSGGSLVEGTHYSFMYYGGRILSHFSATAPEEIGDRISMLTINRNVAVVMDSDRRPNPKMTTKKVLKPRLNLNETKHRMIAQIKKVGGFSWVTEGKEIENYVPSDVWETLGLTGSKITDAYVDIPHLFQTGASKTDKIDLANQAMEHFSSEHLSSSLDLAERLDELCQHIRRWNAQD